MRFVCRLIFLFWVIFGALAGCKTQDAIRISSVVEETDVLMGQGQPVQLPFHTLVSRDGDKIVDLRFETDYFDGIEHPAMLITRAGSNVQVFLDNEWVFGQSFFNRPSARTWNTPQLVSFSRSQIDVSEYIKVSLFAFSGDHILLEPVYVGEFENLKGRYDLYRFFQNSLTFAISVATLVFLLVSLLLWVASGWERNYLMAVLTSLALLVSCHHYYVVNSFVSDELMPRITHASLDWLGVLIAVWLLDIKGHICNKCWLMYMWGWLCTFVNFSLPLNWLAPYVEWLHFVSIGLVVMVLVIPTNKNQSNRSEVVVARLTGVIGCALCAVDMIVQLRIVQLPGLPRFLPLTFFLVFTSNYVILLNRFTRTYKIARRSQKELEMIVASREAELDEYYVQNSRLLSEQARSQERERIMRDLHDSMGSHLVSALAVANVNKHENNQTQVKIKKSIQSALLEMRLLVSNSAEEFQDLGQALGSLRAALEPLLSETGIELQWKLDGFGRMPILTISERMHVTRIIQECITNVLKHTDATKVSLRSGAVGSDYHVLVENNGSRISLGPEGSGVKNMKYRADQLGGKFDLTINASGAVARLQFPFNHSRNI